MACVSEITKSLDKDYSIPNIAEFQCYFVSKDICHSFGFDPIYAERANGDEKEFCSNTNKAANHWAVTDGEFVYDFTARQFDNSAPYPFIGSLNDWRKFLESVWDSNNLFIFEPDSICNSCLFVMEE